MLSKTYRLAAAGFPLMLLAILALTGGSQALEAQEGPIKIAIVDLDRVVALSPAGQDLQARLKTFEEEANAQIRAMGEEAQEIRRRAVEGADSLTQEKLAELQKEYEDKTIAIRRFRDDKQREAEKMEAEALREVRTQLEPVFKAIRDEGGYDLIFNYTVGVVIMASDRIDITEQVLARLNPPSGG